MRQCAGLLVGRCPKSNVATRFPVRLSVRQFGSQPASVELGSCGLSVDFVLYPYRFETSSTESLAIVSSEV